MYIVATLTVLLRKATMRSALSRVAKQLPRGIARGNTSYCRVSGARWKSTSADEGPKWSTPLAKQLAEAITVCEPLRYSPAVEVCQWLGVNSPANKLSCDPGVAGMSRCSKHRTSDVYAAKHRMKISDQLSDHWSNSRSLVHATMSDL